MAEESSLVRLQNRFDISVDWRGFELHPETPKGGIPLISLFPGQTMERMHSYLEEFAASFGVLGTRTPERLPNTRRALAVAEFARDHKKLESFRTLAMRAHWREGRDLENDLHLTDLAIQAGIDGQAALRAADSSEYLRRVDRLRDEAARMGVNAIPTFIIAKERVVGCQPYEVLAQVARRAGVPSK
ncbi:MAG: DsbA family protein [Chloroflexi bacterium]|nr:DsbA family protein [Chloroflexota bacterium]